MDDWGVGEELRKIGVRSDDPQEHGLMLAIFTRQAMLIKALADVMRSRGIIEFDDVAAFDSVVSQQEFWLYLLDCGRRSLSEVAQSLGVETGLEIPPIFRVDPQIFLCVLFSL